jgi:hypothetical protein
MEEFFDIDLALMNKTGHVKKTLFYLTMIKDDASPVLVDTLPLIEYYVLIDHENKKEQVKAKLYKTMTDGRWYDRGYSEEAEIYSPEFGIPEINKELKKLIDNFETSARHAEMTPRH